MNWTDYLAIFFFAAPITGPLVVWIFDRGWIRKLMDAYEWFLNKLGFNPSGNEATGAFIALTVIGLLIGGIILYVGGKLP